VLFHEPRIAAALVGAALLSVMVFPTVAGILVGRGTTRTPQVESGLVTAAAAHAGQIDQRRTTADNRGL